MLSVPGYSVPLPYACGGGESLAEALESLERLQHVCDQIMSNIQNRVDEERSIYDGLSARVTECTERVSALKGRRQAIVVQSSPKFPVPTEEVRAQPCVHLTERKLAAFRKTRHRAIKPITYVPNGPGDGEDGEANGEPDPKYFNAVRLDGRAEDVRPLRPVDPCDVFEFGLLMPQEASLKYSTSAERGLGKFPRNFNSVSSLLLFNTRENPYKEYTDVNLFSQSRVERVIAARRRLGASGNIHQDFTTKASADEYGFAPEMEDAPDLFGEFGEEDLGLENVAILDWQGIEVEDGESIAPTAKRRGGGDGDTELPSVSEMAGIRPSKPLQQPPKLLAIAGPSGSAPPPAPTSGFPPPPPPPGGKAPPPPPPPKAIGGPPGMPPPPPPPPGLGKGPGIPPPAPPPGLPPPPPPPPPGKLGLGGPPGPKGPPPPPPLPPPGPVGNKDTSGLPAPQAGRAALLESIRNADKGALLRKVGDDSAKQKKNMNSFAAQLANRRKGIEGRYSDDDDDEPAAKAKAAPTPAPVAPPAAGTAPPAPAAKAPPPPPPPPPKAPGGKLGGKRQFAEDDEW